MACNSFVFSVQFITDKAIMRGTMHVVVHGESLDSEFE
jgi:hypothetical protein